MLHDDLYLLVHQTNTTVADTGAGGYALGPQVVRLDLDPALGLVAVAERSARCTLLHELHHAARLTLRPQDFELVSFRDTAVFEGLACAFESAVGGWATPWRTYEEPLIAAWARELFAQPVDEHSHWWRFAHPDGRTAIVYRVGWWLAERAIAGSGLSAAELVGATPDEVFALADVS